MYEIIERIRSYNYKKFIFPAFLICIYIFGFIYLDNKISKKELTKIEKIIYEEKIEAEEKAAKHNISKEEYINAFGGLEMIKYDVKIAKVLEILKK